MAKKQSVWTYIQLSLLMGLWLSITALYYLSKSGEFVFKVLKDNTAEPKDNLKAKLLEK